MSKKSSTTKPCKHCAHEIPSEFKVCPHCLKRQSWKSLFLTWALIVAAAVSIGIASASIAGYSSVKADTEQQNTVQDNSGDSATSTQSNTTEEKTVVKEDTKKYSLGETATASNYEVTFSNLAEADLSSKNYKPDSGNVYVYISGTITNLSGGDVKFDKNRDYIFYVDNEKTEQENNYILNDEEVLSETVADGRSFTRNMALEVPKDWQELEIEVNPVELAGKTITFHFDRSQLGQ